ncbi:hypothetical protein EYF80_044921 [Liparis tanakae]|uniref:Uncharacterized protein n=1 Tax=Liparis tanakae TaxID=230148 RepID=A0A4Z2FV33_9TELE|nr:hypothetical protein EYF80_044921 [Liparis tanakae]
MEPSLKHQLSAGIMEELVHYGRAVALWASWCIMGELAKGAVLAADISWKHVIRSVMATSYTYTPHVVAGTRANAPALCSGPAHSLDAGPWSLGERGGEGGAAYCQRCKPDLQELNRLVFGETGVNIERREVSAKRRAATVRLPLLVEVTGKRPTKTSYIEDRGDPEQSVCSLVQKVGVQHSDFTHVTQPDLGRGLPESFPDLERARADVGPLDTRRGGGMSRRRLENCCLVSPACTVRWSAWIAAEPNISPGSTGTERRVLLQVSDRGDCASQTWRRVCTRVDISRPSSLDMRPNACSDASLRLLTEASGVACCRDSERASMRWERELPIRPMRAAVL